MKKTSTPKSEIAVDDDLLPEYDLDYSKGRPNRYAGKIGKSQVVVMLEPDIAEVFTTPEKVKSWCSALKWHRIAYVPNPPSDATARDLFQVGVNQLVTYLNGVVGIDRARRRKVKKYS